MFYDPFLRDNEPLVAGTAAAKGSWQSDGVGTWMVTRDTDGGRVVPPTSGKSHRWTNLSPYNAQSLGFLSVTWTADPGTSRLMGIVFRRTDANNYWIATQTGLHKVVAGVRQPASVSWTKFTTGERMTVDLEASETIRVYRDGVQVGVFTDTFNLSGTQHGLGTEA
jgi:ribosomal protein L24E